MKHDNEKIYYEYLAKLLLEKHFPDKYYGLQTLDKPDLQMSTGHGVEVTRAMFGGFGQATSIFNHIADKPVEEVDPRYISTIRRLGYKLYIRGGIITGYSPDTAIWINDIILRNVFLKKSEKISQYKKFSVIDLFIYSPLFKWYERDMIFNFMQWADGLNNNRFSAIIIFEEPSIFYYHTGTKEFIDIQIDPSVLHESCVEASRIAGVKS